jgi:phosphoenolpyruvate carboxykinase (diphosphate)
MNLKRDLGIGVSKDPYPDPNLVRYINLKLAALGQPTVGAEVDAALDDLLETLLQHSRESSRLLANYLCPADWRIQKFLDGYLDGCSVRPKLPGQTFVLDRHGLARVLSLPPGADEFKSDIVSTYRARNGVLHNPAKDRRTTQGVFHVTEGGLPIPDDKLAVPVNVFANLLQAALTPPKSLLQLPFTAGQTEAARAWVSLLLRPVVCPEVPGFTPEKKIEVRFFVPGNLVGNLDFVESIFGNAGDPFLPQNDAGLDVEHWTGHTGCVILAPHLTTITKQDAGLPPWDQATERQRRDGLCWKDPGELYNGGNAFKLTCRDETGVMVTLIADNYFGYCKKEVKTQLSFAANLFGLCEEEHAGGALVYPSYDLGEEFCGDRHVRRKGHTFEQVIQMFGHLMDVKPEGYAIDKAHPDIIYVPEDVLFDLHKQTVSWVREGETRSIKLLPQRTYVRPSGYKVHMEKPPGDRAWRLTGTAAEGTLCHKPCTVSGGGKSEISKPITDAVLQGPVFVADFKADFDQVEAMIDRDYTNRFKDADRHGTDRRAVLASDRSLGSVIKLLTPSRRDYSEEYNAWLDSIPQYVKELVFVVKRFYKPEWGTRWREHFSVDVVNGIPGNELKCDNRKLVSAYVRVGFEPDGSWRVFGLRKDFHPAAKLSQEDDITAAVVVPTRLLGRLNQDYQQPSVKFVRNCEYRLFQRPDDAIIRGYDKATERDLSEGGNFLSNWEPLTPANARGMVEDSINLVKFTPPMQQLIWEMTATDKPRYFVCNANPRLVDGKPSKNPRYLQLRPDLVAPRENYLIEMATRLHRMVPATEPVLNPVNCVVPGRRNNPPEAANKIRSLAVYNPIHFMELPELLMEFICSMTGKSPSTTGAGSEGALTKGPFNALLPIHDVNATLVSHLLTGYDGFVSAAGYVGPNCRVDHDVSLLIPEIWCRMRTEERDAKFLIENGYFEKCDDVEHNGRKLLFSRLGYRMTRRFAITFFGRMFNHPHVVFTEEMLKPELQGLDVFADGMDNIIETQRRVSAAYFADGSVDLACPPVKALLHIMRDDQWNGHGLDSPEFRQLFTREAMLASDWYRERLAAKRTIDQRLWQQHVGYLKQFLNKTTHQEEAGRLGIHGRLTYAEQELARVKSPAYLEHLHGTLGAEPSIAAKLTR